MSLKGEGSSSNIMSTLDVRGVAQCPYNIRGNQDLRG